MVERLAAGAKSRRPGWRSSRGLAPLDSRGPLSLGASEDAFPPATEFSLSERRVCSGTAGSCWLPGSAGEFLFGRETTLFLL